MKNEDFTSVKNNMKLAVVTLIALASHSELRELSRTHKRQNSSCSNAKSTTKKR